MIRWTSRRFGRLRLRLLHFPSRRWNRSTNGWISALAVATLGSAESIFVIVIAALFVVAFFTVPRIFFAVERDSGVRASFDDFLNKGMNTLTGHNSGKAALVQMLIVPIMLTLGVLAMGIAIATAG